MAPLAAVALLVLAISVPGCTEAPAPEFRLNMVQAAVNQLDDDYQREIANVLGALFGTPDNPQVLPEMGLDQRLLTLAAGPAWTDPDDVTHGIYRRHCVHCHGISGDGRGPTARFLDPYPRDYRKGVFKFKSTYAAAKPTNDDLARVLHNGIPGTSMPSFSLLPQPEIDALVEYVKYLSIRGEVEAALASYVFQNLGVEEVEDENGEPVLNEDGTPQVKRLPLNPAEDPDQAEDIKGELELVLENWQAAEEQVILPAADATPGENRTREELAADIKAGGELYMSKRANCFTCHGVTALGDGQTNDYDDWTKDIIAVRNQLDAALKTLVSLDEAPAEEGDDQYAARMQRIEETEGQIDLMEEALAVQYPIRNAIPRNLRQGVYRGGRRRADIFYRIHAGIKGVPMPGVGATSPDAAGTLTDEEIWQLVDYVLSLPYEASSGPNQDQPINAANVTR